MCTVNHHHPARASAAAGPGAGSVRSVPDRPYTLLSCAVSIDGYLDDASPDRLILSGPEDLDEVDALRAAADAILVGAGTIRADNPRLLVRDPARIAAREAAGKPPHPLRVTMTATGDLDPAARFFAGPGTALVYCAVAGRPGRREEIQRPGRRHRRGRGPLPRRRAPRPSSSNGPWRLSSSKAAPGSCATPWRAIWPTSSAWPSPRSSWPTRPPPASPSRPLPAHPRQPDDADSLRQVGTVAVHHYRLTGPPRTYPLGRLPSRHRAAG